MTDAALSTNPYYKLRGPLHRLFGATIQGLDLRTADLRDPDLIAQLKSDLRHHRLLLLRDLSPSDLSPERQVELSSALGTVESTFYRHPRSPHRDIFRVSNDESEGCRNVGRSGWHVDGTFLLTPFAYQTMHFPSVSRGGDTYFVPLKELRDSVDDETRGRWDKLWMVTSGGGARYGGSPVHPLVYRHPYRGDETMCFHCGEPFVSGWMVDEKGEGEGEDGSGNEEGGGELGRRKVLPPSTIQSELNDAIASSFDDLVLVMKWRAGDLAINDNLGLAHLACPGTQQDSRTSGLRVLHRTTVLGGDETVPRKEDGRQSFVL